MSNQPRASGYFRTSYAQDVALIQTRMQRVSAVIFGIALLGFPLIASSFYLDLATPGAARLDRRAVADAAHRLCRADLARPCRPAVRRRLHRRHPVQGIQHPDLADAAGRGDRRRAARRHLRTAVAAAARSLSRGLDARAAFRRGLSRRRIRNQARLLDRHHHRCAGRVRLRTLWRADLVLRDAGVRGAHAAALHQPDAHPDRARLARDPCARDRGRSARHQCRRPTSCSPS